jgi:hypothetical protein
MYETRTDQQVTQLDDSLMMKMMMVVVVVLIMMSLLQYIQHNKLQPVHVQWLF